MINRVLSCLFLGLLFVRCSVLEGIAAPSARLISAHWLQNDLNSSMQVDHSAWSRFLATYLVPGSDGVNRIAYGRVNAADQALLNSYITMLEASPVSRLSRPEQLAYWINLYNAATVRVVLQHYPVRSIRDIGGGSAMDIEGFARPSQLSKATTFPMRRERREPKELRRS